MCFSSVRAFGQQQTLTGPAQALRVSPKRIHKRHALGSRAKRSARCRSKIVSSNLSGASAPQHGTRSSATPRSTGSRSAYRVQARLRLALPLL